jgi:hypothetical protein
VCSNRTTPACMMLPIVPVSGLSRSEQGRVQHLSPQAGWHSVQQGHLMRGCQLQQQLLLLCSVVPAAVTAHLQQQTAAKALLPQLQACSMSASQHAAVSTGLHSLALWSRKRWAVLLSGCMRVYVDSDATSDW